MSTKHAEVDNMQDVMDSCDVMTIRGVFDDVICQSETPKPA